MTSSLVRIIGARIRPRVSTCWLGHLWIELHPSVCCDQDGKDGTFHCLVVQVRRWETSKMKGTPVKPALLREGTSVAEEGGQQARRSFETVWFRYTLTFTTQATPTVHSITVHSLYWQLDSLSLYLPPIAATKAIRIPTPRPQIL